MADPGLIMMVREKWPEVPIHLSVQANTTNYATVKFWQKLGVQRIILSRELSLDEIEKIRQECPDMELEVFVHGALCIAYSGRCLLSGYFNRRDPNQGTCTNACRWNYATHEGTRTRHRRGHGPIKLEGDFNFNQEQERPKPLRLVRRRCAPPCWPTRSTCSKKKERPGQLMPIMEDEHGTYIMNSKDLRAVEHVQRLARSASIRSRSKAAPRACTTSPAPRRSTAAPSTTRWPVAPSTPNCCELEGLANRGYTGGFAGAPPGPGLPELRNRPLASCQRSQFVGEVKARAEDGWAEVETKNRFNVGDTLEVIHPIEMVLTEMRNLDGEPITAAPGNPLHVRLPLEARFAGALLARRLPQNA
jgi:putative protease